MKNQEKQPQKKKKRTGYKYTKETRERIYNLIRSDSYTVGEICTIVNIAERTFRDWKARHAEFAQGLKKAKNDFIESNLKDCERSLKKLINGYDYEEKRTTIVNDKSGKPHVKEQIVRTKHIQPCLGAIIHYQTNMDPEHWSNKQTTEVTGKDGKDLIPEIEIIIHDKTSKKKEEEKDTKDAKD